MKVRVNESGNWGLVMNDDEFVKGLAAVLQQRGMIGEEEREVKEFERFDKKVAVDLSFVDEIEKVFKDYLKAVGEKRKLWNRYVVFSLPVRLVYFRGDWEEPIYKVEFLLGHMELK